MRRTTWGRVLSDHPVPEVWLRNPISIWRKWAKIAWMHRASEVVFFNSHPLPLNTVAEYMYPIDVSFIIEQLTIYYIYFSFSCSCAVIFNVFDPHVFAVVFFLIKWKRFSQSVKYLALKLCIYWEVNLYRRTNINIFRVGRIVQRCKRRSTIQSVTEKEIHIVV